MFEVWFDGLRVKVSHAADVELVDLGLRVVDAVEVLEKGFDCSRSKRKKDKIERCLRKGSRVLRVVAAYSYNFLLKEDVVVLIHVSIEGTKWSK